MKDKLYRQLDNLWRGNPAKGQVVKRMLLGYITAMPRRAPEGWGYPRRENVGALRTPRHRHTPLFVREAMRTETDMFSLFYNQEIKAEYKIAMPAGGYAVSDLGHPLRYAGTYDKTAILLTPQYRKTVATIVVPPTWHRMVKEVGTPFTKSRNKIVKLIQRVSNRRTYDGGYTVWDVDYFDIKDRNNPLRVEGVGVRNGDCFALEESFPKAYAACKALVVKEALRELKDSIKDEADVD